MKNTATIIVSDDGTDEVRIKCEFGEDGANHDSAAHRTAAMMMRSAVNDQDHDELVEALKGMVDACEGLSYRGPFAPYDRARAAIAKATGESA
jgi:hypothetical protein